MCWTYEGGLKKFNSWKVYLMISTVDIFFDQSDPRATKSVEEVRGSQGGPL